MLQAPSQIYVPNELYEGYKAEISWDPVEGASGYELQRRFDRAFEDYTSGASWSDIAAMDFIWDQFDNEDLTWDQIESYVPDYDSIIYIGNNLNFTDTMLSGASYVIYRIRAFAEIDLSWEEFEAKELTWDDLDDLEWSWETDSSEWTITGLLPIIANRAPVISGEDSNIGLYNGEFPVSFSVYDPDPENTVDVVVSVGSTQIATLYNVEQNREYTVTVDATKFTYGNLHSVIIVATDNKGASSQRMYTFRVLDVTYYIVRDGIAIAKPLNVLEYRDYMEVGEHTYLVRGVDADGVMVDSNEVTVIIKVQHATIANVDQPSNYENLMLREGDFPQTSLNTSKSYQEVRFIGLEDPKFIDPHQRTKQISVSYTVTTQEEYNKISRILNSGVPILYRDHFGNRIVGLSENNPFDFVKTLNQPGFEVVINYSITIMQSAYDEEVDYA